MSLSFHANPLWPFWHPLCLEFCTHYCFWFAQDIFLIVRITTILCHDCFGLKKDWRLETVKFYLPFTLESKKVKNTINFVVRYLLHFLASTLARPAANKSGTGNYVSTLLPQQSQDQNFIFCKTSEAAGKVTQWLIWLIGKLGWLLQILKKSDCK